jgi:hypothetical protein
MTANWRTACLLASFFPAIACAPELEDKERFSRPSIQPAAASPADAQVEASEAQCPDIPPMLVADCAGAGCHSTQAKAGSLDLESPNIPARLLGASAVGGAGALIDPSSPERSVLYTKLTTAPPFGTQMPSPATPYDGARLACVRAWLASVASAAPRDAGWD